MVRNVEASGGESIGAPTPKPVDQEALITQLVELYTKSGLHRRPLNSAVREILVNTSPEDRIHISSLVTIRVNQYRRENPQDKKRTGKRPKDQEKSDTSEQGK